MWFNQAITPTAVEQVLANIPAGNTTLRLTGWDIDNKHWYQAIEAKGYPLISEQAGMSLPLQQSFTNNNLLQYSEVSTAAEAAVWSDVFKQAFNYHVNKNIILQTQGVLYFYLAYYQQQPVGTAVVNFTGDIAGIHSMGVIPNMRRKGFAEAIMQFVLNKSMAGNARYATLQASNMGKGLYLKMGFEEQFTIKSYKVR